MGQRTTPRGLIRAQPVLGLENQNGHSSNLLDGGWKHGNKEEGSQEG